MTAHALLGIKQIVAGPAPQPPGVGPNALLADGWPARILGVYWPIWEAFRLPVTSIPTDFNVIYIFNGRFNTDGSVNLPLGPGDLTIAQMQTCVDRGQKFILTMGGAGLAFNFANRTQSTNFVNSFKTLVDTTLGGLVSGLDWNNYEQITGINFTEMIWASQQLQAYYGPTFAITSPPGATNTGGAPVNGIAMGPSENLDGLVAMKNAGVLTWAAAQFYDWDFYKEVNTVREVSGQWFTALGDTKFVVAFSANYKFTQALTLAECEREWDAIVAAHPDARGMACWNAFTDTTTIIDTGEGTQGAATGNNQWGLAMRSRIDSLYPAAPPPPPPVLTTPLQGVNLSMLETDAAGIRQSASSRVNIDFTIPRAADLSFLASQGFGRHRLCLLWELVQPVLASSSANSTVLTAHGIASAGKMQPKVMGWILDVLDAAAAAGVQIILDLHNFCRYKDFVYQVDGSVTGFNAGDTATFPYTLTAGQTVSRVMSLVAGDASHPTITQADFNTFWTNFVNYVETGTGRHINGHAGVAGYGLMNDPHDMPANGSNVDGSFPEDPAIWTTFAQGAINAIRAVDTTTPIYVAGNIFERPWSANPGGSYVTNNPAYPLVGTNLVYEAHYYLDSLSTGAAYDWTTEAAKPISLGESDAGGVTTSTGAIRSQYSVDFVTATGKEMAVTALGMPVGDVNWQTSMDGALSLLFSHSIGHTLWVGGNHWTVQGFSLSGVPDIKQGQTLLPIAYGVMHKAAARTMFSIFADADTNFGAAGTVCTVTVYTRGYSPTTLTVNLTKASTGKVTTISGTSGASTIVVGSATGLANGVSVSGTGIAAGAKITNIAGTTVTLSAANTGAVSGNGTFTGTLSATSVVLPIGANQSATFTYTTVGTEDATVTFSGLTVFPGVMHFYSMDPATFAATDKTIAGRACLAKYKALEWLAENSYTDYLNGAVAVNGNTVRAVHNSGFGENYWNAHGMKNWINAAYGASGPITLPTLSLTGGKKVINFTDGYGLWNKKTKPNEGGAIDPTPVTTLPYKLNDEHFYVVGMRIASVASDGVIFAVNSEQESTKNQLSLSTGKPVMTLVDAAGTSNSITALSQLTFNAYHGLSARSAPGAQDLRVDKTQVGTLTLSPAPDDFTSMEIGFAFDNFFPTQGFTGSFYGAITGKGAPTDAEMVVMEEYLALVTTGSTVMGGGGSGTDYPAGVAALTAWLDPSNITTLFLSAISGGTVTAPGDFVGEMDSTAPETVNLTAPDDAHRYVLREDGTGHSYLDTGTHGWNSSGGGGGSTGFFFAAAMKVTTAGANQYVYIDYDVNGGSPEILRGYEVWYDYPDDVWVFRGGNGTNRTTGQILLASGGVSQVSGSAFVIMAWDDGTNFNMQINNGAVVSAARPVVVAGAINPKIWSDETSFGSQRMLANNYGVIWAKNSGLNSTDRAGIKTYLGAKAGLTL